MPLRVVSGAQWGNLLGCLDLGLSQMSLGTLAHISIPNTECRETILLLRVPPNTNLFEQYSPNPERVITKPDFCLQLGNERSSKQIITS